MQSDQATDPGKKEYHASAHRVDRCKFAVLLPPLFVVSVIACLYAVFVFWHLERLLQLSVPANQRNSDDLLRGQIDAAIFHVLTIMISYCYVMSIVTHPGTVPDTAEWQLDWDQPQHKEQGDLQANEWKRTGERRYCKWCGKYKPDRCHHCRVCKQCILRMDHHCPWIMNCVGYHNYKYFFLLVWYAALACLYIAVSMLASVHRAVNEETRFMDLFMLVFGETLAILMGLLVVLFFSFHIWLMTRATTTIEFCEKSMRGEGSSSSSSGKSDYDLGALRNVSETLGPIPLLWLLPVAMPAGDGTFFHTATKETNRSRSSDYYRDRRSLRES